MMLHMYISHRMYIKIEAFLAEIYSGLFSSGSYLGNTNSDYSLLNNINYQIHQTTPSEFGLQIVDCDACDTYLRLCIKFRICVCCFLLCTAVQ